MGLDDDELAMLDLERSRWRYRGAKENAIVERFGITAPRYYARLSALIDRPEALAADPVLVRRLRRLRDVRRQQRSAGRHQVGR